MPSFASSVWKAVREALLLVLDPLVEVALVGDELDLLDRERRLAGELARPGERRVEAARGRGRPGWRARRPRPRPRGDRVADQVHLERLLGADQPRQPLGAAEAGDDPELDLGLAEDGRLGGDPEVARHRQLAAAAEGERVDRGDRRDPAAAHVAQQRVARVDQLLAAGLVHLT